MSEPYYETAEQSEISLKLQLEKVYEFVDNSKVTSKSQNINNNLNANLVLLNYLASIFKLYK
jgi:hypothetical protein